VCSSSLISPAVGHVANLALWEVEVAADLQLWAISRLRETRNRLTCKNARFRLQSPELRGTQANRAEGNDAGALSSRVLGPSQ
jgi:hypothetical protein